MHGERFTFTGPKCKRVLPKKEEMQRFIDEQMREAASEEGAIMEEHPLEGELEN